jgi:hypothetical protein
VVHPAVVDELPRPCVARGVKEVVVIPIFEGHDHTQPIGKFADGVITLAPTKELPEAALFEMIGNCGLEVLESKIEGGITVITKARIRSWALDCGGRSRQCRK